MVDKQKKGYGAWGSEVMAASLSYVNINNTSVRQTAKEHGIPRATVHYKGIAKPATNTQRVNMSTLDGRLY